MFKAFVVLRIPISVICLLGHALATPSHALFALGLLVFLGVVSIKLVRFRPDALRLAGWLLAAEVVGAALLVSVSAPARAWGFFVIFLWTLLNAAVLYLNRGRFAEIKKLG